MTAFLFGALQRFGEEVQPPFDANDEGIALDAITRQLEIEMRQRLSETQFPPELQPHHPFLL